MGATGQKNETTGIGSSLFSSCFGQNMDDAMDRKFSDEVSLVLDEVDVEPCHIWINPGKRENAHSINWHGHFVCRN